jgi:hypothetical protein
VFQNGTFIRAPSAPADKTGQEISHEADYVLACL